MNGYKPNVLWGDSYVGYVQTYGSDRHVPFLVLCAPFQTLLCPAARKRSTGRINETALILHFRYLF